MCVSGAGSGYQGHGEGSAWSAIHRRFRDGPKFETKITISDVSDRSGPYHIDRLPAGDYDVRIRAVGWE